MFRYFRFNKNSTKNNIIISVSVSVHEIFCIRNIKTIFIVPFKKKLRDFKSKNWWKKIMTPIPRCIISQFLSSFSKNCPKNLRKFPHKYWKKHSLYFSYEEQSTDRPNQIHFHFPQNLNQKLKLLKLLKWISGTFWTHLSSQYR